MGGDPAEKQSLLTGGKPTVSFELDAHHAGGSEGAGRSRRRAPVPDDPPEAAKAVPSGVVFTSVMLGMVLIGLMCLTLVLGLRQHLGVDEGAVRVSGYDGVWEKGELKPAMVFTGRRFYDPEQPEGVFLDAVGSELWIQFRRSQHVGVVLNTERGASDEEGYADKYRVFVDDKLVKEFMTHAGEEVVTLADIGWDMDVVNPATHLLRLQKLTDNTWGGKVRFDGFLLDELAEVQFVDPELLGIFTGREPERVEFLGGTLFTGAGITHSPLTDAIEAEGMTLDDARTKLYLEDPTMYRKKKNAQKKENDDDEEEEEEEEYEGQVTWHARAKDWIEYMATEKLPRLGAEDVAASCQPPLPKHHTSKGKKKSEKEEEAEDRWGSCVASVENSNFGLAFPAVAAYYAHVVPVVVAKHGVGVARFVGGRELGDALTPEPFSALYRSALLSGVPHTPYLFNPEENGSFTYGPERPRMVVLGLGEADLSPAAEGCVGCSAPLTDAELQAKLVRLLLELFSLRGTQVLFPCETERLCAIVENAARTVVEHPELPPELVEAVTSRDLMKVVPLTDLVRAGQNFTGCSCEQRPSAVTQHAIGAYVGKIIDKWQWR